MNPAEPLTWQSTPLRPPAPTPSGKRLIALAPQSGRFRIDFPDSAGPAQSEERWLMIAIAIGLNNPGFREQIIQTVFGRILDIAGSH